ncbi:MAG: translation initiation factor IF-2, partial [Anaerolineales bacterium]|nr:translation initiation factor IF-2 [Anaerolineales bacterium]
EGVQIQVYDIIYKLLEDVEKALKGLLGPVYEEVVIGRAEVRQIFNIRSVGVIAGCYMRTGVARRNAKVRVIRQANLIHVGSVSSLRHLQDNVREVRTGFEFGVSIDKWNDVQQGDLLEFFVMSQTEQ